MKPSIKYQVIFKHKDKYSINSMCKFFVVSRRGYYAFLKWMNIPNRDLPLAKIFFSILKTECIHRIKLPDMMRLTSSYPNTSTSTISTVFKPNKTDSAWKTKSVRCLKFNFLLQVGSFCTVCTIRGSQIEVSSKIGFNNNITIDIKATYSGYKCVKFAEISSVCLVIWFT